MPPDGAATHRLDLAKAKEFWSFRQVVRPDVPKQGAANPIDNFILAKLTAGGLTFPPPTPGGGWRGDLGPGTNSSQGRDTGAVRGPTGR